MKIRRSDTRLHTVIALPVHFLFHVGGVAAAIVGQQKTSITKPVDVYLNVGAVHHDDISCWGLSSHLQAGYFMII